MDLFHKIEDAVAIVRFKHGLVKQTGMYARGDRVYVPHSGGYLRITSGFDGEYGTAHPDIKVLEFEADGVKLRGQSKMCSGEPRYVGSK